MMPRAPGNRADVAPTPAVIAVVEREGRLLLARRAKPPDRGLWGFPGGRIEPGETIGGAAVRELREETGVEASAERVLTAFDVIDRAGDGVLCHHFVLVAVLCGWVFGEGEPADDVLEVRWLTLREIESVGHEASERVAEIARLALGC